jgi:hypothetical protein
LYANFFNAQTDHINCLSPPRHKKVFQYLDKQVFSSDLEDSRKEIKRQAIFNRGKQRELATLMQEESDGGGSQEMDEVDEEGKSRDNENEGSQGE